MRQVRRVAPTSARAHKLAALSDESVERPDASRSPAAADTSAAGWRRACCADGWEVDIPRRRPSGIAGVRSMFELGLRRRASLSRPSPAWTRSSTAPGISDSGPGPSIEAVNVRGPERLFEGRFGRGERMVHVSTVSASGAPRSMYGRAKLRTEEIAREHGGAVVRPVCSTDPGPGEWSGCCRHLVAAVAGRASARRRRSPSLPCPPGRLCDAGRRFSPGDPREK